MSGLPFTLTTAGRRALVNPSNTGVNALTVSHIGVSAVALPGGSAAQEALTGLPNERKRLTTFGGAAVSPDTIHVTLRDETDDAYTLRAFGLYLSNGVLLAVYSQPAPIAEKVAASMLLLSADLMVASPMQAELSFGPANFMNPPATDTVPGIVELATDAEISTGTDGTRAVTPLGLARRLAVWAQGFAKALHSHAIDDITGLATALSGKANSAHSHDAAELATGVLDAARLPDLAMAKITGLVAALAGKANSTHSHAGEDITTGTVPVARLPDLAMAKITGLVGALAGKANSAHSHAGEDITTGTVPVARLPDLAMAKITGLVAALAGKANSAHSHAGEDITTGTVPVARLPDLAMAKITGLVAALAGKANSAHNHAGEDITTGTVPVARLPDLVMSKITGLVAALADKASLYSPDFSGAVRLPTDTLIKKDQPNTVEGGQLLLERPDISDMGGHLVLDVVGSAFRIWENGGAYRGASLDLAKLTGNETPILTAVDLANNVETAAGASAAKAVTPASLWSFARSIGKTGYAQIPGTPLIIQWGRQTGTMSEGQKQVMLPIAFGGGCVAMLANPWVSSNTGDYYMQIYGRFLDRLVFMLNSAAGSSGFAQGFDWLAIGFATGTPDPVYGSGESGGGAPGSGGGGGGGGGGGDSQVEV